MPLHKNDRNGQVSPASFKLDYLNTAKPCNNVDVCHQKGIIFLNTMVVTNLEMEGSPGKPI